MTEEHSPEMLMEEFRRDLNALAQVLYDQRAHLSGGKLRELLPFILGYPFIIPNEGALTEQQLSILGQSMRLMDIKFNLIMHAAQIAATEEKKDE